MAWWRQFDDPALDELVERAVRQNLDLQAAAARVDQYLGELETTRSQFFPQIGAGANLSAQRAGGISSDAALVWSDPVTAVRVMLKGTDEASFKAAAKGKLKVEGMAYYVQWFNDAVKIIM